MKKQYTAPAIEVVKLNPADLIATSPGIGTGFSDSSQGSLSRGDYGDWEFFEEGDWE